MSVAAAGGDQRFPHLVDVAPIGHSDWNAKTHPGIAVSPIRYGRIDELRVRHDHRNVVIRQDHGAPGANLLHLANHAGHFHPVANGNGSFGQDDQSADEIARDILEPKSYSYANGPGENGQGPQVNAGVFEDNENTCDQDKITDDLGDSVLERTVEAAFHEIAVEEKTLGARRNPKNGD